MIPATAPHPLMLECLDGLAAQDPRPYVTIIRRTQETSTGWSPVQPPLD